MIVMTDLLIKLALRNGKDSIGVIVDPKDPSCRARFGVLSSVVGVVCNIILFIAKLIIGTISGSIAITADAFNNLSDMGSCFISLFGMKLAARPADKDHPFGHGRYEYLTTMAVAVVILMVAFELGKSSVEKIINPEAVSFSWALVIVLVISILVKFWMSLFNRKLGKTIDSGVLKATASDSINDCISTGVVLITTVVVYLLKLPVEIGGRIDGVMGLLVALFILWSGIGVIKENLGYILGEAPNEELVKNLIEKVTAYDGILGTHDLIVHNYGPTMYIATLHAEVSSAVDVMETHDLIDRVEKEVGNELGIMLTIHMDPIVTDCEKTSEMKRMIKQLVSAIEEGVTIHDFRMVEGPTHTNLIFDAVLPYSSNLSAEQLKAKIAQAVTAVNETWFTVVTVDREFV